MFLSASFPSKFRSPLYYDSAHPDEMTQAVVAAARAIFAERGRLTFGGHPTISPLVMMIAEEYLPTDLAERRTLARRGGSQVLIYQSRAFRKGIPQSTAAMERLHLGKILWTPVSPSELHYTKTTSDPTRFGKSLEVMRRRMLSQPRLAGAIFIGGMEGIEREAEVFRALNPKRRPYFIGAPGGAAKELARRELVAHQRVRQGRKSEIEWLRELLHSRNYPALMQRIVIDIERMLTPSKRKC